MFNAKIQFGLLFVVMIFLSACGAPAKTADADVLASTTFLADIAQNIAGERLTVHSILPVGADPHNYQPTPQEMAKIENAKLLILNGAEYEHFLESFIENAGDATRIVEAAKNLPVRADAEGEHGVDPHLWLDPNLVIGYVENIRAAFIQYDPEGAEIYNANAQNYINQLKELDAWIQSQVNQIPAEKRILISNHESLNYFAERYGFKVAGTIVESFSSNAAPSAQQMAALIEEIKSLNASAIFLDAADNDTLATQIASETGAKVVSDLHLESLTEGAPAPTYIEMMKYNVSRIVESLK